jgi:hypothetical protein
MKMCRSSGLPPKRLPHGGGRRRLRLACPLDVFAAACAAFFFGIITTVDTVIEGAAGQSIPTVEGTQRLADRPRGR